MKLSDVAAVVNGTLIGADIEVSQFVIDGRQCHQGSCYIAIRGEHLDGHQFITQAQSHGAVAAIVEQEVPELNAYILVPDTTIALGQIAHHHRQQFDLPLLALTGSCGKTTVKELIKSILPSTALVTEGNLNNQWGVPLTLLRLNQSHSHAVVEIGTNQPGEISYLTNLSLPNIALVNNVAPAHLLGFGTEEKIADEKTDIFTALTHDDWAIINIDDARVVARQDKTKANVLTFSLENAEADVYASDIAVCQTTTGAYRFVLNHQDQNVGIELNTPGRHAIMNALAASAMCIAVGLSLEEIAKGIHAFSGVKGRLVVKHTAQGSKLIDDTYNANPRSVMAAMDVLASEENSETIFVLGELGELGESLLSHYESLGQYAKTKAIQRLFTCGQQVVKACESFGEGGMHFEDHTSLIAHLKTIEHGNQALLVKGSRAAQMEKVVEGLL